MSYFYIKKMSGSKPYQEWDFSLVNIYIIDAYEDIEKDLKKGNYNPFSEIYQNEDFDDFVNQILTMMISECAREFEELPIIEDVDILRNILYSGVWAKFQSIRNKRKQVEEKTDD